MNQLAQMSADYPDALPLYLKAYESQAEGLPFISTVEPVYSMVYSTQYWTGWPTDENMYEVPYDWWPTTLFIVLNLLPSGAPPPVKTVTTTVRETVTQTTTKTAPAETVTKTTTAAATTVTQTETTTKTAAATTLTQTQTQTTTKTETVTAMDMTSVAGAGIVALIIGVIVGWLVGKK